MRYEIKLQIIWSMCFMLSGIIFAFTFFFTGVSGVYAGIFAAVGYIIIYIGLSMAFLIMFSRMKSLSIHLADTLRRREREIREIQKELKHKYLKKKINEDSYKNLMGNYESELTEIQVKLKEIDDKESTK